MEEIVNIYVVGVGDNIQFLFIVMLEIISGMNRNLEIGQVRNVLMIGQDFYVEEQCQLIENQCIVRNVIDGICYLIVYGVGNKLRIIVSKFERRNRSVWKRG